MSNLRGLVICSGCLNDKYLIKQLSFRSNGLKNICTNCSKNRKCIEYKVLARVLKNVIRDNFTVIPSDQSMYDIDYYGNSLKRVIVDILGVELANLDEIINIICTPNYTDVKNGDDRFFDNTNLFVKSDIFNDEFYHKWDDLVKELKTSRRFFSDSARHLFQQIFEDVESQYSVKLTENVNGEGYEIIKEPIVREIPIGTKIFRARKVDSFESAIKIAQDPQKELSPPPTIRAQQGRMNAKGVSVFYGALDTETCIAEMRSSIGNYLVLGAFTPIKALRILDFKRLESVASKISYFQPDAKFQFMRSNFLANLHSLISAPVVSGNEDEYLITQVLAEYLAYVRDSNFDGISFESTQRHGGTNIIIFPKVKLIDIKIPTGDLDGVNSNAESVLDDFSLEFLTGSQEVQTTTKIVYETLRVGTHNFID